MSKMDGLRAMREARYAQAQKQAPAAGARPTVARSGSGAEGGSAAADTSRSSRGAVAATAT